MATASEKAAAKAGTTEPVSAVALEARRAAVKRLVNEAAAAEVNLRIARRLAADPDHPADDALVEERQGDLDEAKRLADEATAASGVTVDKAARNEYRAALRDQVKTWKANLAIHQDYLDHPEAYGGKDVSGGDLDPDEQKKAVAELTAAIAEAEASLATP
jgi:hypothetical protein